MTIDPKVSLWLNIALLLCNAAAAAAWGTVLSNHTAAWVVLGLSTGASALNLILHAYSADKPGPAVR